MSNFFDRFRDLDGLKEQAERLIQQGVRESKRQAAFARLRIKLLDLDRRMNAEFRVLGERVWQLHEADALTPDQLAGAFDVLETLAHEITEAQAEMDELSAAEAAETPLEPAAEPPGEDAPDERKLESAPPAERPDSSPLE